MSSKIIYWQKRMNAAVVGLLVSLVCLSNAFHVPTSLNTGLSTRIVRVQVAAPSGEGDADQQDATQDKKEDSEALKWARNQLEELGKEEVEISSSISAKKKKYVIVGAGWGGWGAAKALCESGIDAEITIIDALPDPTGNTPYLSATGKPVEAGTRGFWKDYPNICELLAELGIEVRVY